MLQQHLKDSLKIILASYKEEKLTEEEVFTLLDSIISNSSNNGSQIITYPVYPNYPNYPWVTEPVWKYEPNYTTSTFDVNNTKFDNGQIKTNVTE